LTGKKEISFFVSLPWGEKKGKETTMHKTAEGRGGVAMQVSGLKRRRGRRVVDLNI